VVEGVVLNIDRENEKFSLGIKQLSPNPWEDLLKTYAVGTEITGEVTNVTDFGAFVRLQDGIEGLVYSSELSTDRVENPADVVKVGEKVTAIVTKVDPVEQKISLSIRAVTDKEARAAMKAVAEQESRSQTATLGDLLAEKLANANKEEE
jgi:small subunit ribosomal protein S1